jgi:DNA polymerase-3 subunit delta
MTRQEFYRDLRKRKFAPVYSFRGEEDFLIDEAVESLIAEVLPQESRSFNLDVLYGNEVDARDVVAHANSFPMGADHRVVILREYDRLDDKEILQSYVQNPSPSTILVLISKKADAAIRVKATAVDFDRLYESDLPPWITERGSLYEKRVSREACDLLLMYVGTSLRALDNELEKIAVYVGDKKTIDAEDVAAVVGISKTHNVFELTRAVGNRDLKRSVEILERMMEFGEYPPLMVAALTKHFMTLLKLTEAKRRRMSEGELASSFRLPPRRVGEYKNQLRHYSPAELEKSFAPLARADEKLKYTSEDPRSVMTVLLHELIR